MGEKIVYAAHRFQDSHDAAPDPIYRVEQCLLGTLLSNPKLLDEMPDGFGSRHFLDPEHGAIYEAIGAAASTGQTFILPLVRAALPDMEGKDKEGRPTNYVASLIEAMVGTLKGMAAPYAQSIMEAALRRDLIELADAIKRDAMVVDATGMFAPVAGIVTKAAVGFDRLIARQPQGRKAVLLGDAVDDAIAAGEAAALRGSGLAGISTGYRCIDNRLSGFEPETLSILAGRPGMGKTALAAPIAVHVSTTVGPVLFISLEMAARQLGRRALSITSGIPVADLKSGEFTRDRHAMEAVVNARRELCELPLSIEDEPALSVDAIRHRIKAATRRMGELALVVIDHLHLVGRPDTAARHGDTHAITEISRGAKRLAKEFGVPVLLLAQLNRGVEGRDDKRPALADLRQSGAIEEDADAVMMLYREEYYAKKAGVERRLGENEEKYYQRVCDHRSHLESVAGKAELLFEKVRDGKGGGAEPLRFDGERMRFFEEGERA